MTIFLSVVMTLFLMGLFAISFLGGRWPLYSLLDYLKGFLGLLGSMVARPLGFSAEESARSRPRTGKEAHPSSGRWCAAS